MSAGGRSFFASSNHRLRPAGEKRNGMRVARHSVADCQTVLLMTQRLTRLAHIQRKSSSLSLRAASSSCEGARCCGWAGHGRVLLLFYFTDWRRADSLRCSGLRWSGSRGHQGRLLNASTYLWTVKNCWAQSPTVSRRGHFVRWEHRESALSQHLTPLQGLARNGASGQPRWTSSGRESAL